jgi:tetratricopeptide (TPR) repeat protein
VSDVAAIAPEGVAARAAPHGEPPAQAVALRARATAAGDAGRPAEAERLFLECLEVFPAYGLARHELSHLLLSQNRLPEALTQADRLLSQDPFRPGAMFLKASICARLGAYDEAIALYTAALDAHPGDPRGWLSLGHAQRAVGRLPEAVAAYRQSLELAPHLGDAWWSLANLKTVRFTAVDVAAMQRSLHAVGLSPEDHVQIHFALGKAKEDAGEYAASFAHYAQGARLRRRTLDYSADHLSNLVERSKVLTTPDFFAARSGQGCQAPDPIFVVGLPRAGSTLVEQILCSHSQVEGTHELPDILKLAARFGQGEAPVTSGRYPDGLTELSPESLRRLGEEYLESASVYRTERRPFFIDKMPNNFAYAGLIHLILPRARIIDVRRHPLGCGFSVFKQHFAYGQAYTYDLTEIGRYYADYVKLMDHMDSVLPGRVHRVIYERLVSGPETEIRRLLAYCGLPFEDACLRFHESGRPVRTPSSEQVRSPMFTAATDHWRNYEPWLEPLKASLGPVLGAYSETPVQAPAAKPRRRRLQSQ